MQKNETKERNEGRVRILRMLELLWTQSDKVYDMTSDAQKFVDLYNEVADYFSYDTAEKLLEEYNASAEEY